MSYLISAVFKFGEVDSFRSYAQQRGVQTLFFKPETGRYERNAAEVSGLGYENGNPVLVSLILYYVPPGFSVSDDGSFSRPISEKRELMETMKRYGVSDEDLLKLSSIKVSSVSELTVEQLDDEDLEGERETVSVRRSKADLRVKTKDQEVPELVVRPHIRHGYGSARPTLGFVLSIPKREGDVDPRTVLDQLRPHFEIVNGSLSVGGR